MTKLDKKMHNEAVQAEKTRITIKNMGYKDNAPPLISVMGPSQSGKSTLLRSIMKHYWKSPKSCTGPVTMKMGHKRFTFYECPDTLETSIDTVKVSDMIVFVVSLENGIENRTLELINMMNSHGVPKFCFVLTHCDSKASNKAAKEVEKRLEKQFSFPIKLFGMKKGEEDTYENVGKFIRYIEVMKYRPIEWKCVHPYIVVDCLRDRVASGYLRGGPISTRFSSHIPGVGDYQISGVEEIDDPCSPEIRSNVFYCPFQSEDDAQNDSVSSVENLSVEIEDIKIFEDDQEPAEAYVEKCNQRNTNCDENSAGSDASTNTDKSNTGITDNATDNSSIEDENTLSIEVLKNTLRSRFQSTVSDETEIVEKFNREYSEKETKDLNILETMKKKELNDEIILKNISGLIIPGAYIKFRLDGVSITDPSSILVVGAYLPTEGTSMILKGKINKNRNQKFDLKSNAPYFFSVGWCRFQSIPIFCKGDRFVKYCKEFTELAFLGPNVPLGTGFFVFSFDSEYKILGSGQVLDTSGKVNVKKKLKLIGHPKEISGRNVIVQSMFSSSKEANRFLNARLNTVSGLRGLIKSSIGVDGCFRAVFEGPILMSETIFLKCFVPCEPYKFLQNIVPNARYIRHLKTLKEDESESKDTSESFEDYRDESLKRKEIRTRIETQKLEKQQPFLKRSIREIKQTIDLPVPPEQRKIIESKIEIEAKRKKLEEERETSEARRKEERIRKIKARKEEAEESRRKSAVKSFLSKKKHKKRR